jgi:hypothetical protein
MAKLLISNNPKKRRARRKPTKRRSVARRRNPVTPLRARRRRSNPSARKDIMSRVIESATGAAGAMAVDFALQKMPFIPAEFTQGPMKAATKGLVSVAIGYAVGKFAKKKKLGEQLAYGGMTVALYEFGKESIGPSLGLSYDSSGELLGSNLLGMDYYSDNSNTDVFNEGMSYYGNAEVYDVAEDF